VLALRAFNLETMLIGEQVKSREPIVTQIRCASVRGQCQCFEASHDAAVAARADCKQ
jgi:hypothetical protein